MNERCKHEYETKQGYPDDIICRKCGTIWTLSEYADWTAKELMRLPKHIREALSLRASRIVGGKASIRKIWCNNSHCAWNSRITNEPDEGEECLHVGDITLDITGDISDIMTCGSFQLRPSKLEVQNDRG